MSCALGAPEPIRMNASLRSSTPHCKPKPPDGSHWSVRSMAQHTGVSKSTVQRWFNLFGVQPHRQRHFKLSNDPFFIEKVRDIVGLYLNPPDHAVVLCVDEENPGPSLAAHPAHAADGTRLCRGGYPRLHPSWHYHPVCRSRRRHRRGHHSVQSAPSSPRVPLVPASCRGEHPARLRRPISSSITTPPTNIPRSKHGWQSGLDTTSTSPQPTPHGSIRWNAGSASLPRKPSVAALSPMSKNW